MIFKKIILKNTEYTFSKNYQSNYQYRSALNRLVKSIFGISFEQWYKCGYWNEKYIPYTLFDGEKAVSNVSVNIMDFNIYGDKKRFIQIGTVLTDEHYRNQHLNRFLMDTVLEEWNDQCDLIYLFANPSVLNMYPKFGFKRIKEFEYYKTIDKKRILQNPIIEKLNMDIQSDKDKLYDYAKKSVPFGKLSMQENADLVMFYCIDHLKENVFYIPSLDVIAVALFQNNELHLWDVFSKTPVDLEKIIYSLANANINKVVLGFTPQDDQHFEVREHVGDDVLFIQNDKTALFDKNKLMFPLLSHA